MHMRVLAGVLQRSKDMAEHHQGESFLFKGRKIYTIHNPSDLFQLSFTNVLFCEFKDKQQTLWLVGGLVFVCAHHWQTFELSLGQQFV